MTLTFFNGAQQTYKVESSTVEIQRTSISDLFVKWLSISLKVLKYLIFDLQDQMNANQDWARNVQL